MGPGRQDKSFFIMKDAIVTESICIMLFKTPVTNPLISSTGLRTIIIRQVTFFKYCRSSENIDMRRQWSVSCRKSMGSVALHARFVF